MMLFLCFEGGSALEIENIAEFFLMPFFYSLGNRVKFIGQYAIIEYFILTTLTLNSRSRYSLNIIYSWTQLQKEVT